MMINQNDVDDDQNMQTAGKESPAPAVASRYVPTRESSPDGNKLSNDYED